MGNLIMDLGHRPHQTNIISKDKEEIIKLNHYTLILQASMLIYK